MDNQTIIQELSKVSAEVNQKTLEELNLREIEKYFKNKVKLLKKVKENVNEVIIGGEPIDSLDSLIKEFENLANNKELLISITLEEQQKELYKDYDQDGILNRNEIINHTNPYVKNEKER